MKCVKMIGLAVVGAMTLMAVVAASASANAKVCSTVSTGGAACKAGHGTVYKGKIVAKLEATTTALWRTTRTSGETVNELKCSESTLEGETTNGETGTGKITKLTFGGCSAGLCPNGVTLAGVIPAGGWAATITTTTAGVENTNGIIDVTDPELIFHCKDIFNVDHTCEYTAATAQVHVTGSDTAPTMKATGVQLNLIGGSTLFCGNHASWTAAYNITTPASLFIE